MLHRPTSIKIKSLPAKIDRLSAVSIARATRCAQAISAASTRESAAVGVEAAEASGAEAVSPRAIGGAAGIRAASLTQAVRSATGIPGLRLRSDGGDGSEQSGGGKRGDDDLGEAEH